MAKLIYIHTLGYSTTFAQMECLKLVVSQYYSDKRIGYLGLMLLMDEKQEILMLVTNSLKNDLSHPNHFIVGLALCALANIASAEMCRDCSSEIEKLVVGANPYLKKKATLCAVRICRKVPDLRENYIPLVAALVNEKNHGVKITGLTLLSELLDGREGSALIPQFREHVPLIVRTLKQLIVSGYAPEYDVSGSTDPFLQVRLLRLMRVLAEKDQETSDQMNDVLAQVATNTETARNVGNAILYEAVSTIMSIKSETGLRVLAINILGKFLSNKDNNIRYVALAALSKVVVRDVQAVQRHRNTIVDCLRDTDVSIRRRALDLIYALVNPQNVRILVRELLNFLLVSDVQFRPELTQKLCAVAERHAPNRRWHIDTMLRVISLAGAYVPEQVPHALIFIIGNTPELHSYAVYRAYDALSRQGTARHDTLTMVGVWCIGEYGDLLIGAPQPPLDASTPRVAEADALQLLDGIAQRAAISSQTNNTLTTSDARVAAAMHGADGGARVRSYVATALVKLLTRFSPASFDRIKDMLRRYATNIDVEVQQRAVEYLQIATQEDAIRREVTQRMPVLDEEQMKARGLVDKPVGDDDTGDADADDAPPADKPAAAKVVPAAAPAKSLLDVDDMLAAPAATSAPKPAAALGGLAGLDDIFGGGGMGAAPALAPMPTLAAAPSKPAAGGGNLMDDLLGGPMPTLAPAASSGSSAGAGAFGGLNLLGGAAAAPAAAPAKPAGGASLMDDLLGGGLLGGGGLAPSPVAAAPAPAAGGGLFGLAPTPAPAAAAPAGEITAYDKAGVRITFSGKKHPTNAQLTMVRASFHNLTAAPVSQFVMQVAVPKYITLQLDPATGTDLPPGSSGAVTQVLKLANSLHGERPLLMKLKIDYATPFGPQSDLVDFTLAGF
jgi:AP-1 complex subunit gamma-1